MNLPAEDYRCYRHPDREAYISCQRCGRLICPECMREASVGFQCPSCIAEGAKTVRQPKNLAGGAVTGTSGAVSLALIVINVLAYVVTAATGGQSGSFFRDGALVGYFVADGETWRLVTSAFLHAGLLHLLFNMYALYLFGPFVERALGTIRFIVAYATVAIAGSVFVYLLAPPGVATIGASGAVFGLFGMAMMLLLKAKQDITTLLVLLAINAFISVAGSNISWQGHLGGFVAGVVLGAVIAYAPRERRQLFQAGVIVVVWIAMIAAVVLRTASLTG
ncbi:rhomboid family intramembrane serine protease [Aeromicrobium sp. SMF47]|uniref:rhomboid family intramembrane serine protease n=1 Tax=Aeromicrobium TaxID=2040 RepID=UPI00129E0128|nr:MULTISPECIES: rhomboid family intramembrane serine protease [Aeromicrobium]MRJ75626.1 rhomboid family intramembrane serine protease [Aeromicrobium yanjiei]MRJ99970.1 rhomboid family intramembrane serine protease [Aeromicrobium sp. S22]